MLRKKWLCEPCEHRWWQHRHPDPGVRLIGFAAMTLGAVEILLGLRLLGVL